MIKAYKGFNKDLTCTMGNGKYQYREGVWIEEKEANCGANGLHCCYNPLDVLHYYSDFDKHVFYLVAADGDIHEDGVNTRISCTKMKLVKKLPVLEFVVHAMAYMYDHPHLKCNSNVHKADSASCEGRTRSVQLRQGRSLEWQRKHRTAKRSRI